MGNPHDDHDDREDLARPAWLDGAGPSGENLPEGFADPDWYVDPEAARLGAARLNPQWLDLSVFSAPVAAEDLPRARTAEPRVVPMPASDANTNGTLLNAADPDVQDEPEHGHALAEQSREDSTLSTETSAGEPPLDRDSQPVGPGAESTLPDVPHGSGPVGGIDLPTQVLAAAPTPREGQDSTHQGESTEGYVPDLGAVKLSSEVVPPGEATTVGEEDAQEEEDPYRPRFAVAPRSVQVSAVLQYALAAVNTLVAAILVAVLVSSSSSLEVPFVAATLSRPTLIVLVFVIAAAAVVAVLSAIGLARGEERWWKAGFVAPVATIWCLPLSAAIVVSLLRPDTKDWVI